MSGRVGRAARQRADHGRRPGDPAGRSQRSRRAEARRINNAPAQPAPVADWRVWSGSETTLPGPSGRSQASSRDPRLLLKERPAPSAPQEERSPQSISTELQSRSTRVKGRFFPGLEGRELERALKTSASPKETLGYRDARRVMFTDVDGESGKVRCVYTQRAIETPEGIPDADQGAKMNCEHTWPKSKGVKGTPAKSDLHHLFPTDSYANARRGNFPFGVVDKVQWSTDCGAKVGWSARGEIVFEPPPEHKGDVARAMFYISTIYGLSIGQSQAEILQEWHDLDPPDAAERGRNDRIERVQGNRNPFVDDPELVRRLWS